MTKRTSLRLSRLITAGELERRDQGPNLRRHSTKQHEKIHPNQLRSLSARGQTSGGRLGGRGDQISNFINVFETDWYSCNQFLKEWHQTQTAKFGELGNPNMNVQRHPKAAAWYQLLSDSKGASRRASISPETLDLVKHFVSSNSAFTELRNPTLRSIVKYSIQLNSFFTFLHTIFPEVDAKMKAQISKQMNDATYVCLIPDSWTSSTPVV